MRLSKVQTLKLGQLLLEKGLLKQEQLDLALAEQKKTKKLLGEVLVKMGLLKDEALYHVLSEQSSVDYVKLKGLSIAPELIDQIPVKLATHYRMLPIQADALSITVATSNPINIHTLDDLTLILNKSIKFVLASEKDVVEAIKKYYGVGAETVEAMSPA